MMEELKEEIYGEAMNKLDTILLKIRKKHDYDYQPLSFIHLFDICRNKARFIKVILTIPDHMEHNFIKIIGDIINYYERNNLDEFKQIILSIIPTLEVPKKQNIKYHQTGLPDRILICGTTKQTQSYNRIRDLRKQLEF